MQVIGANGQGLANAIFFCGFTKKVRKRLLTSARARCLHLKRLCCCCRCSAAKWRTSVSSSSDYDELVDSDDLDKRNDSSRNGTESQYGLLGDFSNTSISCNSLQDSQSQSWLYFVLYQLNPWNTWHNLTGIHCRIEIYVLISFVCPCYVYIL